MYAPCTTNLGEGIELLHALIIDRQLREAERHLPLLLEALAEREAQAELLHEALDLAVGVGLGVGLRLG